MMSYNTKLPLLIIHPRNLGNYTTFTLEQELKDTANVIITREAPLHEALLIDADDVLNLINISMAGIRQRIAEMREEKP